MPSLKNGLTAEKCHRRFENVTTVFNIGRTLFVEGHEALPCWRQAAQHRNGWLNPDGDGKR